MMQPYFQSIVSGIEARLEAGTSPFVARKKFSLEIARLGARLFAPESRVAWCGVLAPFDLLHAAGVDACFVEFVGAMLASTGAADPMLEVAEHAGYSQYRSFSSNFSMLQGCPILGYYAAP